MKFTLVIFGLAGYALAGGIGSYSGNDDSNGGHQRFGGSGPVIGGGSYNGGNHGNGGQGGIFGNNGGWNQGQGSSTPTKTGPNGK